MSLHLFIIEERPLSVLFNVADVVAVIRVTANVADDRYEGVFTWRAKIEFK